MLQGFRQTRSAGDCSKEFEYRNAVQPHGLLRVENEIVRIRLPHVQPRLKSGYLLE